MLTFTIPSLWIRKGIQVEMHSCLQMCNMYVLRNHRLINERNNLFHPRIDMVLDYRLIVGGSTGLSFDNPAYRVANVWRGFWALFLKILVFPRPPGYMFTFFMFSLQNRGIFHAFYKWIRWMFFYSLNLKNHTLSLLSSVSNFCTNFSTVTSF